MSGWAAYVFERLQRINRHRRMKINVFVVLSYLVINLLACLDENLKQFKLLRFPIKGGNSCAE